MAQSQLSPDSREQLGKWTSAAPTADFLAPSASAAINVDTLGTRSAAAQSWRPARGPSGVAVVPQADTEAVVELKLQHSLLMKKGQEDRKARQRAEDETAFLRERVNQLEAGAAVSRDELAVLRRRDAHRADDEATQSVEQAAAREQAAALQLSHERIRDLEAALREAATAARLTAEVAAVDSAAATAAATAAAAAQLRSGAAQASHIEHKVTGAARSAAVLLDARLKIARMRKQKQKARHALERTLARQEREAMRGHDEHQDELDFLSKPFGDTEDSGIETPAERPTIGPNAAQARLGGATPERRKSQLIARRSSVQLLSFPPAREGGGTVSGVSSTRGSFRRVSMAGVGHGGVIAALDLDTPDALFLDTRIASSAFRQPLETLRRDVVSTIMEIKTQQEATLKSLQFIFTDATTAARRALPNPGDSFQSELRLTAKRSRKALEDVVFAVNRSAHALIGEERPVKQMWLAQAKSRADAAVQCELPVPDPRVPVMEQKVAFYQQRLEVVQAAAEERALLLETAAEKAATNVRFLQEQLFSLHEAQHQALNGVFKHRYRFASRCLNPFSSMGLERPGTDARALTVGFNKRLAEAVAQDVAQLQKFHEYFISDSLFGLDGAAIERAEAVSKPTSPMTDAVSQPGDASPNFGPLTSAPTARDGKRGKVAFGSAAPRKMAAQPAGAAVEGQRQLLKQRSRRQVTAQDVASRKTTARVDRHLEREAAQDSDAEGSSAEPPPPVSASNSEAFAPSDVDAPPEPSPRAGSAASAGSAARARRGSAAGHALNAAMRRRSDAMVSPPGASGGVSFSPLPPGYLPSERDALPSIERRDSAAKLITQSQGPVSTSDEAPAGAALGETAKPAASSQSGTFAATSGSQTNVAGMAARGSVLSADTSRQGGQDSQSDPLHHPVLSPPDGQVLQSRHMPTPPSGNASGSFPLPRGNAPSDGVLREQGATGGTRPGSGPRRASAPVPQGTLLRGGSHQLRFGGLEGTGASTATESQPFTRMEAWRREQEQIWERRRSQQQPPAPSNFRLDSGPGAGAEITSLVMASTTPRQAVVHGSGPSGTHLPPVGGTPVPRRSSVEVAFAEATAAASRLAATTGGKREGRASSNNSRRQTVRGR